MHAWQQRGWQQRVGCAAQHPRLRSTLRLVTHAPRKVWEEKANNPMNNHILAMLGDTAVVTGHGEMRYFAGHRYVGEWLRGKKHGKGRFEYVDGNCQCSIEPRPARGCARPHSCAPGTCSSRRRSSTASRVSLDEMRTRHPRAHHHAPSALLLRSSLRSLA